jgi:hypothetical protein
MKMSIVAGGLLSAILLAGAAQAGPVYQTGFEQPDFTTGAINGQSGWNWDGVIQSDVVHDGSQALEIDAQTDQHYLVAGLWFDLGTAGSIIDFKFSFLETGSGGSQFALGLWGDTGFVAQLATSAGQSSIGNTNNSTPRQLFALDRWHDAELRLNFIAGTMSGWVDGTSLGTLSINNPVPPSSLNLLELNSFGAGADVPQKIYFDDLSISVSAPEPASWAMMLGGFGLMGAAMRSRRKRVLSLG